jgi:NTP pyrophosphatase (non-canonical NTP hydrolase)
MVSEIVKPGEAILAELDQNRFNALELTGCVLVVAGERLDTVKKQVMYNKPGLTDDHINVVMPDNLSAGGCNQTHMAVGIAGEAAELLDAILTSFAEGTPLDLENVIEELGDIEFYMSGLRQQLQISRDEVLQANINKLSVRYEGLKYSDDAAKIRADKA